MVYQKDSKFVAVITCNGKILRDFKNDEDNYQVKLPFGSEYGIRFKNLNTTKCAFSVYIDGEDVLNGSRIILNPNESHDLEGFMDNNVVKNKFKFIEKTQKISEYRGDKIDDGMIRIEYQFEKKPAVIEKKPIINTEKWTISQDTATNASFGYNSTSPGHEGSPCSMDFSYKPLHNTNCIEGELNSNTFANSSMQTNSVKRSIDRRVQLDSLGNKMNTYHQPNFESQSFSQPTPPSEDGITVKGSQTNIQYKTGWLGEMEEVKHVMVLTLSGHKEEGKKKVAKAVTVKDKITCPTCGTKNKSSNKFCSECGTSLV